MLKQLEMLMGSISGRIPNITGLSWNTFKHISFSLFSIFSPVTCILFVNSGLEQQQQQMKGSVEEMVNRKAIRLEHEDGEEYDEEGD